VGLGSRGGEESDVGDVDERPLSCDGSDELSLLIGSGEIHRGCINLHEHLHGLGVCDRIHGSDERNCKGKLGVHDRRAAVRSSVNYGKLKESSDWLADFL
jgi:hypothetical protein